MKKEAVKTSKKMAKVELPLKRKLSKKERRKIVEDEKHKKYKLRSKDSFIEIAEKGTSYKKL